MIDWMFTQEAANLGNFLKGVSLCFISAMFWYCSRMWLKWQEEYKVERLNAIKEKYKDFKSTNFKEKE